MNSSSSSLSQRSKHGNRTKHPKNQPSRPPPSSTAWGNAVVKVDDATFPLRYSMINRVYNTIDSHFDAAWTASSTSSATGTSAAYFVTANLFGSFASYAACFDQYRIRMLEFTILPRYQGSDAIAGSTAAPPYEGLLCTAIDIDNIGALPFTQLIDYPTSQVTQANIAQQRVFRPYVQVGVLDGGSSIAPNAQSKDLWLDCVDGNIRYYGLKFATSGITTFSTSWDIILRAHIQFKNQL